MGAIRLLLLWRWRRPRGGRLGGFIADRVTETIFAVERDFSHGKLRLGGRLREVLAPEMLLAIDPPPASDGEPVEFGP
jgi:hypothetical protein